MFVSTKARLSRDGDQRPAVAGQRDDRTATEDGVDRASSEAELGGVGADNTGNERTVYAGQHVARDDPFVTLHPRQFTLVAPDLAAERG